MGFKQDKAWMTATCILRMTQLPLKDINALLHRCVVGYTLRTQNANIASACLFALLFATCAFLLALVTLQQHFLL